MRYMTTAEIREKYLNYFQEKGCKLVPSSSLIPDDPSLLLTSAGMVQFKPYFLQQKQLEAPYIGTTSVQKCVRTNDIDIIGTTGRHLSFFEMLGNFSFGEYFKEEMCAWAYDFSVNVLGLPPERLYFTVFEDDDETIEIWKNLGVSEDHISRLGEDDNFWRAGPTGPCGPCSEIYYDQGPEFGCGSPDCAPGCDCDRFLEYWNCVFTQYDGQEDGTLAPLPKKNIDTGMGLERMAAIMQGVQSNYETDVLRSLVAVGERLAGVTYGEDAETDLALRIIADHSRSVTFMIADGILPGNEGRGYVLRRLLRRAIMKAQLIGIEGHFLNEYVDEIVRLMGDVYPEIVENRELERGLIMAEEDRFGATLRQGQAYLEEALGKLEGDVLSGEEAFTLHDTYGFPVEVTQEIAEGRGVKVDMEAFEAAMEAQRERARAAGAKDAEAAWSTYGGVMNEILEAVGPTEFLGYTKNDAEARVLALVKDGVQVDVLEAGDEGRVVLDATPFYAEKGGQIGDTGVLAEDGVVVAVLDTKEPEKGLIAHTVKVESGRLSAGDAVHAAIDVPRRERIRRNHTATHILHWALREVLGDHVKQAGSYVADSRLRFDFTHFEAITPEELHQVEELVNDAILEGYPVVTEVLPIEEAKKKGAVAMFGEKYGETVRVVEMGDVSIEFCGGTHVDNTAKAGPFRVKSETSVASGVRRIEATCGKLSLQGMERSQGVLHKAAQFLKTAPAGLLERMEQQANEMKQLRQALDKLKAEASLGEAKQFLASAKTVRGLHVITTTRTGMDVAAMRTMGDFLRDKDPSVVAVIASINGEKVSFLAVCGKEAVARGIKAGDLVRAVSAVCGGKGGGKPDSAMGGGTELLKVDDALASVDDFVSEKLS